MKDKYLILTGLSLVIIGAYLSGALDQLLNGDTIYYLKTAGGLAGTAAGIMILEHTIVKRRRDS